jgi:septal ring factor EnvC (AmiA/AmiB activator)
MTENNVVLKQIIKMADLLDQLTKEVAKMQQRIKKIEDDHNPENLLSESEKNWLKVNAK